MYETKAMILKRLADRWFRVRGLLDSMQLEPHKYFSSEIQRTEALEKSARADLDDYIEKLGKLG